MALPVTRGRVAGESVGAQGRRVWEFARRLGQQRGVPIALGLLVLVVLAAVFASVIAPYDPNATNAFNVNKAPTGAYWLGTDAYGRDIFSRLIFGSRVAIEVGAIAVSLAIAGGVPLGLCAGYFGGLVDMVIMRLTDVVIAFPAIILALAIMGTLGAGIPQLMVAIGFSAMPLYARLTRGQTLSVREQDYVLAARAMGGTDIRLLRRHILPNVLSPLIVQGSLGVGFAILSEAGLSFLGVGVKPPTATWGGMLSQGLSLIRVSPYVTIFPGLAIFITVLAINTIGDALRDVLDPRLRGSR